MIEYRRGSLFDAPYGSVLLHACNCRGVWGSGIAAEFAYRYPKFETEYQNACKNWSKLRTGSILYLSGPKYGYQHDVICMFTSDGYGKYKDDKNKILKNTAEAIWDLRDFLKDGEPRQIHLPKINSGLFGVPWELTERVIYGNMDPDWTWTVWMP